MQRMMWALLLLAAATGQAQVLEGRPLPPLEPTREGMAAPAGIQGKVLVAFSIDARGRTLNPAILNPSVNRTLDTAALHALGLMHFDVPTTWATDHALL